MKKKKKIKKEKRKAHTGGQKGEEMGLQRSEKSGSRGFALVTILHVRVRVLRIFNILEGQPSALQTVNQIDIERHCLPKVE